MVSVMAKDKGTPASQAPVKYVTVARRAETEFEEKKSIADKQGKY